MKWCDIINKCLKAIFRQKCSLYPSIIRYIYLKSIIFNCITKNFVSMWLAGALGAAIGVGFWRIAAIAAALGVLVIVVMRWVEDRAISAKDDET